MKLVHKLFATLFLTGLPIFFLTIGGLYYFTSKHFANYVAKQELDNLAGICEALKDEYRRHNGWENIKEQRLLWDQIIREHQPKNNDDVPRKMKKPSKGMPRYDDPEKPLPPPAPILARRLTLYDGLKHVVIGWTDNPGHQDFREIVVDDKMVGWLGLSRSKRVNNPLELGFIIDQTNALFFIGFFIMIVSALVAFLLARNLLKPIQRLAVAARAMASRRFETRVNVESTDELGVLAQDFNEMAVTLERYESMRRQWIADISHELRTPLTVLRGEIESVLDGLHDMKRETIEFMHYEVMRLFKLINDLHTLTIIESELPSITNEKVDVFALAENVLKLFTPRFADKGIEVQRSPATSDTGIIMGDPDRLAQVFSNLFENSLRYTDTPGKLRMCKERKEGLVWICIEDTEPGVPDSALPFLFDRLYRVDPSRSRKNGGSGLGMAITKTIVEAHNGTIKVSLSPLGGLKIDITFPLAING